MEYWQIALHIRGYYHRNVLRDQLLRHNVWASMFCMGNPERKMPEDIIHLYSDDYIVTRRPPLTDREHAELMDTLDFYKEQNEKNGQP